MPTRIHFHEKLEDLTTDVLLMGGLVEQAIGKAIYSLAKNDRSLAAEVIRDDEAINDKELFIENRCIVLLATEQPVACDLRLIVSTLKTIRDLERIGDYAAHLAKAIVNFELGTLPFHDEISKITEVCVSMLKDTLTAYSRGDVKLAEKVRERDEIVDTLYLQLFNELLSNLRNDKDHVKQVSALLLVAKYLERLADHITNICEEIVFMCTGKRKDWAK
ncbi:MAG: phosphate signaling complex protein PhoU [Spirochaetales bacterium]|nr:phosphate signaling complex protein PhoU [Spirochaetales bacterium]